MDPVGRAESIFPAVLHLLPTDGIPGEVDEAEGEHVLAGSFVEIQKGVTASESDVRRVMVFRYADHLELERTRCSRRSIVSFREGEPLAMDSTLIPVGA